MKDTTRATRPKPRSPWECPVSGCRARFRPGQVMCRLHWYALTIRSRAEIKRWHAAWLKRPELEHTKRYRDQALRVGVAQLEGKVVVST